jgi:hypothetical protein
LACALQQLFYQPQSQTFTLTESGLGRDAGAGDSEAEDTLVQLKGSYQHLMGQLLETWSGIAGIGAEEAAAGRKSGRVLMQLLEECGAALSTLSVCNAAQAAKILQSVSDNCLQRFWLGGVSCTDAGILDAKGEHDALRATRLSGNLALPAVSAAGASCCFRLQQLQPFLLPLLQPAAAAAEPADTITVPVHVKAVQLLHVYCSAAALQVPDWMSGSREVLLAALQLLSSPSSVVRSKALELLPAYLQPGVLDALYGGLAGGGADVMMVDAEADGAGRKLRRGKKAKAGREQAPAGVEAGTSALSGAARGQILLLEDVKKVLNVASSSEQLPESAGARHRSKSMDRTLMLLRAAAVLYQRLMEASDEGCGGVTEGPARETIPDLRSPINSFDEVAVLGLSLDVATDAAAAAEPEPQGRGVDSQASGAAADTCCSLQDQLLILLLSHTLSDDLHVPAVAMELLHELAETYSGDLGQLLLSRPPLLRYLGACLASQPHLLERLAAEAKVSQQQLAVVVAGQCIEFIF